jgi:hypothetical protein
MSLNCHQRVIIRFLHHEGVSNDVITYWSQIQFIATAYKQLIVQYWTADMKRDWTGLHEVEQSGRRPIDHIDLEISAFLRESPFYSR